MSDGGPTTIRMDLDDDRYEPWREASHYAPWLVQHEDTTWRITHVRIVVGEYAEFTIRPDEP